MDELYKAKKEAYQGKLEQRISRYNANAKKAATESATAFNRAHEEIELIPLGQPILVGHHSEKKHRGALNRHDQKMRKGFELQDKAAYYNDKAAAAESNNSISSDDPDAVKKLKEKLAKLEAKHEFHIKCNKEFKKHITLKNKGEKYEMQLNKEEKETMLAALKNYPDYSDSPQPFPSYLLSNETAKIRETKNRIKKLETHNARNTENISYSPEGLPAITIEKDVVENRFKVYPPSKVISFDLGLPAIFKRFSFHWSPTNKCYQRLLLNCHRYEQPLIDAIRAAYAKNKETTN